MNRKSIIFIFGAMLSITAFFIINYVLPKQTNYSASHKKTLVENENFSTVKPVEMATRHNYSREDILKYLKEGKSDRSYNIYLVELNKRYSFIISPLIFIVFALAFSGKLKKYPKIGFTTIIFSCFL